MGFVSFVQKVIFCNRGSKNIHPVTTGGGCGGNAAGTTPESMKVSPSFNTPPHALCPVLHFLTSSSRDRIGENAPPRVVGALLNVNKVMAEPEPELNDEDHMDPDPEPVRLRADPPRRPSADSGYNSGVPNPIESTV